ncbi:hypothetical protein ACJMK2_018958 [Sinanodonta woodiana]|uniref:Uncharacterized protein n=1 Tax=Sinanodonta woodiana TaxID=1069815 RepID=A0ABD3UIK6_SINWO
MPIDDAFKDLRYCATQFEDFCGTSWPKLYVCNIGINYQKAVKEQLIFDAPYQCSEERRKFLSIADCQQALHLTRLIPEISLQVPSAGIWENTATGLVFL